MPDPAEETVNNGIMTLHVTAVEDNKMELKSKTGLEKNIRMFPMIYKKVWNMKVRTIHIITRLDEFVF